MRRWMPIGMPHRLDPDNEEARRAVGRIEEILRLDPSRRGLSVRERARALG